MPPCKLASSNSADFHSFIYTLRIPDKGGDKERNKSIGHSLCAETCQVIRWWPDPHGENRHSIELPQCLSGRAERPGDSPHAGSLPSSQSMQLGVNGNKNHSSFFLSTHLSFCRARIYNTHLGYYSLLFTHFTFCFQASPCFSPQSPLNKHKSALSWFPPFPPIRLAGV